MAKNFVSNSPESTRMFRNNFLELCSKVHFSVPIFLYLPVIGYFTWRAFAVMHVNVLLFFAFFAIGMAVWSFVEYVLHRFLFHYHPKGKLGERINFIFHGVHHDYPNDQMRLVLPPSVSVPLAFLFYFIFSFILNKGQLFSFFPGFVLGYLIYDITHYAIHHFNFKAGWWQARKKHHMLHHYQDASKGYGVSSKLWDHVFQSDFAKKEEAGKQTVSGKTA